MRIRVADGKHGHVIFLDELDGTVSGVCKGDLPTQIPENGIRRVFDRVRAYIEFSDEDDAVQLAKEMATELDAVRGLFPQYEHSHIISINEQWKEKLSLDSTLILIDRWMDLFGRSSEKPNS